MVRGTLVAGSEEGFHLVHVVGDAFFAEESAAVLRDEHVVFDADATEILVFLDFVEAEELGIRAFLAPEVNEGGDEVDTGLVGDHVALFQAAGKAQRGRAKLCAGARLLVVAHEGLAEALHVVYVHTHGVAQSVGQEEGMRSGADGFVHIAAHETGAIENSGHKVLTVPNTDGKIAAGQVEELCRAHYADASFEHTVQPGMVYISNPTEFGTVYTRGELEALRAVCKARHLPLFIDGARLGAALNSPVCDYTLADMARMCDVFTIGGTKMGLLFGEAAVFSAPELAKDFRYFIKQNGGMLAKGRLLGVQFYAAFKDGLYDRIGAEEVRLALRLRDGFRARGWSFLVESPSNQQFPILPDALIERLAPEFSCSHTQSFPNGMSAVRFCTSWATTDADIDALLDAIPINA